jgi:Xaa-Pro aminopeptidase
MSVDLARDPKGATGIERHYPAEQFSPTLGRMAGQTKVIYTPFRAEEASRDVAPLGEWDGRLTREHQFVKLLKERFPQAEVRDCAETIWEIRRIKSPAEVAVMRKAGRIGAQAMFEVMKAASAKPASPSTSPGSPVSKSGTRSGSCLNGKATT